MKIKKSTIKEIIREEISAVLSELVSNRPDAMRGVSSATSGLLEKEQPFTLIINTAEGKATLWKAPGPQGDTEALGYNQVRDYSARNTFRYLMGSPRGEGGKFKIPEEEQLMLQFSKGATIHDPGDMYMYNIKRIQELMNGYPEGVVELDEAGLSELKRSVSDEMGKWIDDRMAFLQQLGQEREEYRKQAIDSGKESEEEKRARLDKERKAYIARRGAKQ
tara:strand:- start:4500 stop:5159 length:660 start_codon:yes stop_codon:yes gene_type:complete